MQLKELYISTSKEVYATADRFVDLLYYIASK